ncbi:MAG: single-stranded DNA-binding protein [Flavobacteriales bacterium]|nr:single-stranded DNA-binding protein [Flavobacteriales bacterium]
MASVNKVILVGNLGKDPEIKNFEGGGMIAQFPIATTDSYFDKEKNQRIELPTDWHNVVVKRPGLAKVAQQFLHKGSQVYIEGRIKTKSYQTKENETRWITEVVVDELVLTGKAPGVPGSNHPAFESAATSEAPESVPTPAEGDDLPF